MFDLFRYAQPIKWLHQLMSFVSLLAAVLWLYFSVIHKQLMQRMIDGQAELLDALIGFPLVLALAIVIYASVYWFIKWLLIMFWPQSLTLPPETEEHFDPSQDDDVSDTSKR